MTRLKFLVFAFLTLGLWGAHLFLLSPAVGSVMVDQATGHAFSAPAAVALRLESSRSELQAAVLKLASTPAITNPGPRTAKPEAPSAERFAMVRTAVAEALPENLRPLVIVGVSNDIGALIAKGTDEAAAAPEGFDAKVISLAGGKGEIVDAFGGPHLFYSLPMFGVDKNEVRAIGAVMVGLPLAVEAQAIVDTVAKDLSLTALGLSIGGKEVAASGTKKNLIPLVRQPGKAMNAEVGPVTELGPLKLPILTASDVMGGASPLEIGIRRDIPGTPFEVVAVASVRPAMTALAGYQKTALFMFAGLLIAAIAFTLLMGSAQADEEAYVGPRAPLPPPIASIPARPDALAPLPIADAPAPAEASPDDFNFGPSTPARALATSPEVEAQTYPEPSMRSASTMEAPRYSPPPVEEPGEDPFAALGPPAPPPQRAPPPPMSLGDDDFESQRTTSYPAHGYKNPMSMASTQSNPAVDPFAMAGGMMSADEQAQGDNPDATRVAIIPQELLKASARGNTKENPMAPLPRTMPGTPRVASVPPSIAAGGGSEDAHFQEVFRDFVTTRERCGEPADGLTFDKFVAKLRKNKEQLVAKYNCKTVRFQVYVKEGKAALKATPVKE